MASLSLVIEQYSLRQYWAALAAARRVFVLVQPYISRGGLLFAAGLWPQFRQEIA